MDIDTPTPIGPPPDDDDDVRWAAGWAGVSAVRVERVTAPGWGRGLISRDRLLTVLRRGVHLGRVTGVCAPAGYGKTVLLADFVRESSHRYAWLRLDDVDRDPQQLLQSLATAVDMSTAPTWRTNHNGSTRTEHWAGRASLALVVLVNRLNHPADERVIILDEFDAITDNPAAVSTLAEVVRRTGSHIRLIVAGRSGVPRTLLSASDFADPAVLLDADALRFDRSDLEALFDRVGIPVEDWQEWHQRMVGYEGWPVAVTTALKALQLGTARHPTRTSSPYALFALLADQLVAQLDSADRTFLHEIANLEYITPDLCRTCLDTTDAHPRLRRLASMTPFLEYRPRDDSYRLHGIFRHYVRRRVDQAGLFSSRQHQLAAKWFRDHGDEAAEIKHLAAAGDVSTCEERVRAFAQKLERSARWHTLLDLTERLEATGTCLAPDLASLKARAQIAVGNASGAIETTTASIQRTRDDWPSMVNLHLTRGYARRFHGDYESAMVDAETALAVAGLLTPPQLVKAHRVVASLHASQLHVDKASDHLSRAVEISRGSQLEGQHVLALSDLSAFECLRGRPMRAARLARDAARLADELEYVDGRIFALNNLGAAHHLRGAYTAALRTFEEVLMLARWHDHPQVEILAQLGLGDLYADLEHYDSGLSNHLRGLSLARASSNEASVSRALLSLSSLHRMRGDLAASRSALEEAAVAGLTDEQGRALLHIADGALRIEERNLPAARDSLSKAVSALRGTGASVDLARALLLVAYTSFQLEGIDAAIPHLDAAVAVVCDAEGNAFLIPTASRMPRLWGAADAIGRPDLRAALAAPDLRPRIGPGVRGLPDTARVDDPHPGLLTLREREVVLALCEGLNRDEVAVRLSRSRSTIDKTISTIYASTGFTSAHQLVAWAFRCGMFDPRHPTAAQGPEAPNT